MNMAVCDDEKVIANQVAQLVEELLTENHIDHYEIDFYDSAENMITTINQNKKIYDVVFLDINIEEEGAGFEIAKHLKQCGNSHTLTIFLTSYEQYVFNCFEYDAFYFVRKSCLEIDLRKAIQKVLVALSEAEEDICVFQMSTYFLKLPMTEIIYFEKDNRKVKLVSEKGNYEINNKLVELVGMLEKRGFIMIHQSIIVNAKHIVSIEKEVVVMKNTERLPLSRHRVKQVKEAFNRYL